ncbi:MBL fold metallo-hydrolase [Embleya sp. NBC_00896]|uniref:ComEC/Rec2 family competence protein n=1 Tax=Embleya sp. NBC_00896 TaxID=2975961 RepID=UPI002F9168CC|nr:MBL fold metallo-hydrolase [Embleya sp. NBC_00896]
MPLHLDIMDVGQGDGMVVWLPNGKVMMVDLGSTKNKDLVTADIFKYFNDHTDFGRQCDPVGLEWLVLTHGDRDHYNMVELFLERFKVDVRNVLHGGLEADYGGLIGRLRQRQNQDGTYPYIQTGTADSGFFPLLGLGADVTVLALGVEAGSTDIAYKKNTRSVVLRIVYQGVGLMLTGDATGVTEEQIIGETSRLCQNNRALTPQGILGAAVLKIAHHGSHRTSNRAVWLGLVNPTFAFISSDRSGSLDETEKPTGHRLPQALTMELLERYAPALCRDCGRHSYVVAYQRSDYEQYNSAPDIPNDKPLEIPACADQWIQKSGTEGIFSTLATMGISKDPNDPGAADAGVQYRVSIWDDGSLKIYPTECDWGLTLSSPAAS